MKITYEQYLTEAAGSLQGLPPHWIRAIGSRGGGENSSLETTSIKVRSWSALTGEIKRALTKAENEEDGVIGVAVYIEDMPIFMAMKTWAVSSNRAQFIAMTNSGNMTRRVAEVVRDYDAERAYKMRTGYSPRTMKKQVFRDSAQYTKNDLAVSAALAIQTELGISPDDKKFQAEFSIRYIKADKVRKEIHQGRVDARSNKDRIDPTKLAARSKMIQSKLKSSSELNNALDAYNKFTGESLNADQFFNLASSGKRFIVDAKQYQSFIEASQKLAQIAGAIQTAIAPNAYNDRDSSWLKWDLNYLKKTIGLTEAEEKEFDIDEVL